MRRFTMHRNLLISDGRIAALDCGEPSGVRRYDLQGATVLPAFADCHVHLAGTGYALGERNLAGVRSYDEFDAAIACVPREDGTVYAAQYDDARWRDGRSADALPLERHHAGARAMAVRVDAHSCLVNAATLSWLKLPNDMPGIERDADGTPTGRLNLDANWTAQSAFIGAFSGAAVHNAERRAVELALRNGAVHLHAQLLGRAREEYAHDIDALRGLPAKIHPKVCEPDAMLAQELGLRSIGGDVFLDGSIGSCTAALGEPYAGSTARGALRFSDDEVHEYFARAEELGIAAGVHAIGDGAIDQCMRTWERVLGGRPSPRGVRHFIEHFEMATDEHIEACSRMNIYVSMQPQFDAAWANEGGMYDERLGTERSHRMNRLADITQSGAVLCGGTDSPVCVLEPLAAMQACLDHHQESQRLDAHAALAAFTVNAARFGYAESLTGNCAPGLAADLAVLDRDPFISPSGAAFGDANVLQTWVDGSIAYDAATGFVPR
jgi:hypothetical protein